MRSFGWSCEVYKDALGASSQGHEVMAKFVDPTTVVFVQGKNKKQSLGDVTKRQLVIMATLTVGLNRGETHLPQFAEFPPDPSPAAIALEIVKTMARTMALSPRMRTLGEEIERRLPLTPPKQIAN